MVGGILGRGLTLFDPPIELLADVYVTNIQDGQILVYQASTNQWVNKSLVGSGITITQNSTQVILTVGTPSVTNLVAEDGTTLLTAEDGTTQLITES